MQQTHHGHALPIVTIDAEQASKRRHSIDHAFIRQDHGLLLMLRIADQFLLMQPVERGPRKVLPHLVRAGLVQHQGQHRCAV